MPSSEEPDQPVLRVEYLAAKHGYRLVTSTSPGQAARRGTCFRSSANGGPRAASAYGSGLAGGLANGTSSTNPEGGGAAQQPAPPAEGPSTILAAGPQDAAEHQVEDHRNSHSSHDDLPTNPIVSFRSPPAPSAPFSSAGLDSMGPHVAGTLHPSSTWRTAEPSPYELVESARMSCMGIGRDMSATLAILACVREMAILQNFLSSSAGNIERYVMDPSGIRTITTGDASSELHDRRVNARVLRVEEIARRERELQGDPGRPSLEVGSAEVEERLWLETERLNVKFRPRPVPRQHFARNAFLLAAELANALGDPQSPNEALRRIIADLAAQIEAGEVDEDALGRRDVRYGEEHFGTGLLGRRKCCYLKMLERFFVNSRRGPNVRVMLRQFGFSSVRPVSCSCMMSKCLLLIVACSCMRRK